MSEAATLNLGEVRGAVNDKSTVAVPHGIRFPLTGHPRSGRTLANPAGTAATMDDSALPLKGRNIVVTVRL